MNGSQLTGLRVPRRWPKALACLLALAVLTAPASPEDTTKPAVVTEDEERVINIHLGTSEVVQSPWPVSRVSITSPDVADVTVLSPQQVLLLGKAVGRTDLIMWSSPASR